MFIMLLRAIDCVCPTLLYKGTLWLDDSAVSTKYGGNSCLIFLLVTATTLPDL